MADKKGRGVSNLPVSIPDVPDAPTVSASDVGTSRAYNNGAATVTLSSPTGGLPTSYSITTTPATTTTVATGSTTITGLSSGTSYTVSATATNGTGVTTSAGTSGSFTATTVPQNPTIGSPSVATGQAYTGSANVSVPFTPGATGGAAISSYTVLSSSGNSNTGASSPITVSDTVGVARTYTVTATNANGTSTASSASAATTPSSVPQAPTIGTVTRTNNTTVSIPFTANATGGSSITSYTATSSPSIALSVSGTTSPLTVTGTFAGNTSYTFTVTATNANGTSLPSGTSNSVTPSYAAFTTLLGDVSTYNYSDGVVADSSGNIYYGVSDGASRTTTGKDAVIVKQDVSGTVVSKLGISGSSGQDLITNIGVDSSGNQYIFGYDASSTRRMIMKLNSSNVIQWQYGIYNGDFSQVYCRDMLVDSSGNMYIACGTAGATDYPGVLKIDSTGAISGRTNINTNYSNTYGFSRDSSGNIYSAVATVNGLILYKFNSSLTAQYGKSTNSNRTQSAVCDSLGNVYGWGNGNTSTTFYVHKLDTTFTTVAWQRTLTNSSATSLTAQMVATDSSNNVYFVGTYNQAGFNGAVCIFKYDTNGNIQWQRRWTFTGGYFQNIMNARISPLTGNLLIYGDYTPDGGTSDRPVCLNLPADGSKTGTNAFGTYESLSTFTDASSTGLTVTTNGAATTSIVTNTTSISMATYSSPITVSTSTL